MDTLIQAARRHSSGGNAEEMALLLRKFEGAGRTLRKSAAAVDVALQDRAVLDPAAHSYAFVVMLLSRLEGVDARALPQHATLLPVCHDLFASFSVFQVSFCMADFFHLAALYVRLSAACGRPSAPLSSFSSALRSLGAAYPGALTPLHAHFVQLCVRTKHFRLARALLQSAPLYAVRSAKDGWDALLYLELWYYAGVVHCTFKQWSAAVEAFQLCLAVPASAVSSVQVAAYKKLILAHLLDAGEVRGRSAAPMRTSHTPALTRD